MPLTSAWSARSPGSPDDELGLDSTRSPDCLDAAGPCEIPVVLELGLLVELTSARAEPVGLSVVQHRRVILSARPLNCNLTAPLLVDGAMGLASFRVALSENADKKMVDQ